MADPKICEEGGRGMLLPISALNEFEWSPGLRGFLYAVMMIYFFFGVSVIADIFMSAIEEITSRRKKVTQSDGRIHTENVWNETVANLSLMALGSSGPEIFLSVIEMSGNEFYSGDLGPSTIVGSAAFNLFVIVAVCMISIPDGETRQIAGLPVFYVTAIFSIWAYVWLVVVLNWSSPNEVEVWEAVITLLYLPLLMAVSYYTDVKGIDFGLSAAVKDTPGPKPAELEDMQGRLSSGGGRMSAGGRLSCNNTSHLKDLKAVGKIRASARISQKHQLMRQCTGRVSQSMGRQLSGSQECVLGHQGSFGFGDFDNTPKRAPIITPTPLNQSPVAYGRQFEQAEDQWQPSGTLKTKSVVQFLATRQCFSESLSKKAVCLVRSGDDLTCRLLVKYSVYLCDREIPEEVLVVGQKVPSLSRSNGPEVMTGQIVMERDERQVHAEIPCQETSFKVVIRTAELDRSDMAEHDPAETVGIGAIRQTFVVKEDDGPGTLKFCLDPGTPSGETSVLVNHTFEPQKLQIVVVRQGGCMGDLECTIRTEKFTAMPGVDFEEKEDSIVFQEGVTEQIITIGIMAKSRHRVADEFLVILQGQDDVQFDEAQDGEGDSGILTVKISAADESASVWKKLDEWINLDTIKLGNSEWIDQIKGSIFVNGSLEEQREASAKEWAAHIIALPWKLVFMFVPPTGYCGGWVCFFSSLIFLGGVTAVVADMAAIFGCVLKIEDSVTAITFVALGTSMPDLFASLSAAAEDPTADASIVNVTGSNSVNVFLGLGVPWTVASLYWSFKSEDARWTTEYGLEGQPFLYVSSDSLGFSVGTFSVLCVCTLAILLLRRRFIGCELGGPKRDKWVVASVMISFWLLYCCLASWYSMTEGKGSESVVLIVLSSLVIILLIGLACASMVTSRQAAHDLYQAALENEAEAARAKEAAKRDGSRSPDPESQNSGGGENGGAPTSTATKATRKCTGEPLTRDWSRLMSVLPPTSAKRLGNDLIKVKEMMEEANYRGDDWMLDSAMVQGVKVVCPLFSEKLDIPEPKGLEIFEALELSPGNSPTDWLKAMCNVCAVIEDSKKLSKALLSEADKMAVGNKMFKVIISIRLAKLGVCPVVVDKVRNFESSFRGISVSFMDPDGEDSMSMIEQVARSIGVDVARGMLRPIFTERLTSWGLQDSVRDEVQRRLADDKLLLRMRTEICRAFLCDRPTAWDLAQLAVGLNMDAAAHFYRPILTSHLSHLGFNPQVSQELGDQAQDPAQVRKLQRLLDQAIQRPFWVPPDMWVALGFDLVASVGQRAVRHSLLRCGMLEDDACRIAEHVNSSNFGELREPLFGTFLTEGGLTLSNFEELGEILDVNPREVLLKPLIRGRLAGCGVPVDRAAFVSESVLSVSMLQKVHEPLALMSSRERFTIDDLVQFGKDLGVNFVANLVVPLIVSKLEKWGVPLGDANELGKLCTKPGVLFRSNVSELLSNIFLQDRATIEDFTRLAEEVGATADRLIKPIKKAAFVRLSIPEASAELLSRKSPFGFEDELESLVRPLLQGPATRPDVEDLIDLVKDTDLNVVEDVLRPMLRTWLVSKGVRDEALQVATSKLSLSNVLRAKRSFSLAVLANEPSMESIRALTECLGLDSAVVLGPMLHMRLAEWHIQDDLAWALAERGVVAPEVQELVDGLLFGAAPTAAMLVDLCARLGSSSPLISMLSAWLVGRGVPTDNAETALSAATEVDEVLLYSLGSSDGSATPDASAAGTLLRSALPPMLERWGFAPGEAQLLALRFSEVNGRARVEHIAGSLVLGSAARVEDLEELALLARVDMPAFFLHPIVQRAVLHLCVSVDDTNKVADECFTRSRTLSRALISRVALRDQPTAQDAKMLLHLCGVSTANVEHALQAQLVPSLTEPEPLHHADSDGGHRSRARRNGGSDASSGLAGAGTGRDQISSLNSAAGEPEPSPPSATEPEPEMGSLPMVTPHPTQADGANVNLDGPEFDCFGATCLDGLALQKKSTTKKKKSMRAAPAPIIEGIISSTPGAKLFAETTSKPQDGVNSQRSARPQRPSTATTTAIPSDIPPLRSEASRKSVAKAKKKSVKKPDKGDLPDLTCM